ncbi:hypothetical protein Tco_0189693 [Tanacetum coccineum]
MDECLALADLGASINLMPFSMWKKLNLPNLTPTVLETEMADRLISVQSVLLKMSMLKLVYSSFQPTSWKLMNAYYDPEGDILILKAHLIVILTTPEPWKYLPKIRIELKLCEDKTAKSSIDEPPEVELKDLPPHLEYAFLEDIQTS